LALSGSIDQTIVIAKGKEVMGLPFVRITSFPQTEEVRSEISEDVTEVIHKATQIPKENIWVVFEPMPPESWAAGGSLIFDKD
jgi:phenylpyruvate tautomerase PptA (4-oxalocrotonate tautomerase family)